MDRIRDQSEKEFLEACEIGDIRKAKDLIIKVSPSRLKELKTSEGRTCVHLAVLAGDLDLLRKIKSVQNLADLKECIKVADRQGDTALHVAVREYSLDMVHELLKLEAGLCNYENNKQEIPLNIAIRLQFLKAVELLLPRTQSAREGENNFFLHRAVSLNQVKLLRILINFFGEINLLSNLINLPYQPATNSSPTENSASNPLHDAENRSCQSIVAGDYPLHIAARNKHERIVDLLLAVPGRKKYAPNGDGKTPVDVAREVTEYHESFRIIRKLGDYKKKGKPFMYSAPQTSHEKQKRAADIIQRKYTEKYNAELLVAALLATMSFGAFFSVANGFQTNKKPGDNPGIPVLISFTPFKVFFLFNSIAFLLALFTCIMWELTSDLTTGDKLLFVTANGIVICLSFAFTAFGFIAALFMVLKNQMNAFSKAYLEFLIFGTFWGVMGVLYVCGRFLVSRARFLHLCGAPQRLDDFVACVWTLLECCGLLDITRFIGDKLRATINGEFNPCGCVIERRFNCSASACFTSHNNVEQSV